MVGTCPGNYMDNSMFLCRNITVALFPAKWQVKSSQSEVNQSQLDDSTIQVWFIKHRRNW